MHLGRTTTQSQSLIQKNRCGSRWNARSSKVQLAKRTSMVTRRPPASTARLVAGGSSVAKVVADSYSGELGGASRTRTDDLTGATQPTT